MAENEVKKEKATVKMSIWFILFLVAIIAAIAVIFNQNQQIATLTMEKANLESKMNVALAESNERSAIIIRELEAIVKKYGQKPSEEVPNVPEVVIPEVSVGTYTGATAELQMTLTLAENNLATLAVVNESGDTTVSGTYSLVDTYLSFTSDDGLTTYSFVALENGSLSLVDGNVELTLSK